MKKLILLALSVCSLGAFAQEKNPEVQKNPLAKQGRNLVVEGTETMIAQNDGKVDFNAFAKAESKLRAAISLTPESVPAKYNAGNNYYKNQKWVESTDALVKATAVAKTKNEKHQAFHNLGNALYQQEQWDGAVEAYKNALRANPTDEETRYNLQLAKKKKDENGGGGGGGDDNEENEDENQDKDQNQEEKKGDGDQKEGDDGDEKETDDDGEEKEDEGKQKEDENGKPEDKDKDQSGGEGKEDQKQPPPKPQQGQLSPQQVQSLLKAMQDQEQKTQEKINAQKVKGAQVKTEKDW